MAGKVQISIRVFKGDDMLREEQFSQPVIKIGRQKSSHLRLEDPSVGAMHAVIEATGPQKADIIDLGSKRVFVNGRRVDKAQIQAGDTVMIGDFRLDIAFGVAAGSEEEEEMPTMVNQQQAASGAGMSGDTGVFASTPRPAGQPGPQPPPPMAAAAPVAAPPSFSAPASFSPPPGMGTPSAAPPAFGGLSAPNPYGHDLEEMGGSNAVEVAAMLGESVVGVKHVMNPRGGKITPVTYGMFIGGAVMLLMSMVAFYIAVGNATDNKAAQTVWTEELKRPLFEFRPVRLSLGYDWMAFGGLAGGLIAFTMGMLRYREERLQPYFRIGNSPDVEYPTEDSPAASFALVAPLGDDFVFNFAQTMEGEMSLGGQTVSLAELHQQGRARPSSTMPGALELQIPPEARIRVRSGKSTFLVSSVPRPKRQAVPMFASWEGTFMAFFAASAIFHMGFWALLRTIPPDPRSLALDLGSGEGRLTNVQAKPEEDPLQEEPELEKDDGEDESGGTGTAMTLDEGKMGKEDSERATGQYKMEKTAEQEQLARQAAVDSARDAGFLGAMKAQQGGAFSSLTGTGDFSSGFDDQNIYGGLLGDEAGEMQGGFGFGRSGFGPGGGGTGWGTIGTGRYGTIGHGSGTGSGYGVGSGRGGMRGRTASVPQVKIGTASTSGELDKEIIRRYIRRKLPQIKYCYEKQLLVKPGLEGTVNTQFQISPAGAVLAASASGVAPDVASCVADVIKTIQFPKPKGGGLVQVKYPFTFRPSGG